MTTHRVDIVLFGYPDLIELKRFKFNNDPVKVPHIYLFLTIKDWLGDNVFVSSKDEHHSANIIQLHHNVSKNLYNKKFVELDCNLDSAYNIVDLFKQEEGVTF
jgi:hypothetical protein